jgi:uncharacterized protein (TIGR02145 family)
MFQTIAEKRSHIKILNMKKLVIILFFLVLTITLKSQDYLICFAGSGDTNMVTSVKVDNLISGETVTINGGDTLHLIGGVGTSDKNSFYGNMNIYPNPMTEQSILTFVTRQSGNADICIVNLNGEMISQTSAFLSSGLNVYRVSGLPQGLYFVKVAGNSYNQSIKLVSQNNLGNEVNIEFVSSNEQNTYKQLKSTSTTVSMAYSDGDRLLFKGISGPYSTIITDVPISSKTITFEFVTCQDTEWSNYTVVKIGSQTWMAENLAVGVRIDGSEDQLNNGILEKFCYEDNDANCEIYGGLYQWNEMMQYITTPGFKGICPDGWHLPDDPEWTVLINYLGGQEWAGNKMKETGTMHWAGFNADATNESGLTVLPAGGQDYIGNFFDITKAANFWSSSEYTDLNNLVAWYRSLYFHSPGVARQFGDKNSAWSVRCVRD